MRLSIFFPMWNEEEYVERAIAAATKMCVKMVDAGYIGDYELIIVDDCSTDATPQIADRLAAEDPHVVAVHHPVNRKLGGAMNRLRHCDRRSGVVLRRRLAVRLIEVPKAIRLMRPVPRRPRERLSLRPYG